jgi:hypothetical protein
MTQVVAGGTETSAEAMSTARNVASEMEQQVRAGKCTSLISGADYSRTTNS